MSEEPNCENQTTKISQVHLSSPRQYTTIYPPLKQVCQHILIGKDMRCLLLQSNSKRTSQINPRKLNKKPPKQFTLCLTSTMELLKLLWESTLHFHNQPQVQLKVTNFYRLIITLIRESQVKNQISMRYITSRNKALICFKSFSVKSRKTWESIKKKLYSVIQAPQR